MNHLEKTVSALLLLSLAACQSTAPDQVAQQTAAAGQKPATERAASTHNIGEEGRKRFIAEHDSDGDGRVSRAEFEQFRAERFKQGDSNGDGLLDEREYVNEYATRLDRQILGERKVHVEQTHTRFKSLDRNKDGAISREEYLASGERAFAQHDPDKTGRVVAKKAGEKSTAARNRSVLTMPTSHSVEGFLEIYDEDADGVVTRAEFDAHRQRSFAATDANGDGSLSESEYLAEFESRLDRQANRVREAQIKQAHVRFGVLDSDKSGTISPAEYLATGMRSFTLWDTDGDGAVSAADPLPSVERMQNAHGGQVRKKGEATAHGQSQPHRH